MKAHLNRKLGAAALLGLALLTMPEHAFAQTIPPGVFARCTTGTFRVRTACVSAALAIACASDPGKCTYHLARARDVVLGRPVSHPDQDVRGGR